MRTGYNGTEHDWTGYDRTEMFYILDIMVCSPIIMRQKMFGLVIMRQRHCVDW